MAWTTPITWTTGQIVAASDMNLQIRDNLNALFTRRFGHTYLIPGTVAVAVGQVDFIPPFFASVPASQVMKLVSCRYVINAGTSVTAKLQKNGVDVTGFTAISVTTTAASTTPTAVTLADLDKIALVVTAVAGAPQNMTFVIFIDYQVQ